MDVSNLTVANEQQRINGNNELSGTVELLSVAAKKVRQQSEFQPRVEPVEPLDAETLKEAVQKLAEFTEAVSDRGLRISIDDDLSKIVVKVVNEDTEEVIRQIPTEEVLALMKQMRTLSEQYFGETKGWFIKERI